jgi:hypothetical protein
MTAKAPEYPISKRVQQVWKKLSDWYSAATIAREFGAVPPKEWCEVIDSIKSRKDLDRILGEVRQRHVTFPPRLPEFEKIVEDIVRPPTIRSGPTIQEQLVDFVTRTKALTPNQLRGWQFLYAGPRGAAECTGVVIPADGDQPGYHVTVEDMHMHLSQEPVGRPLASRP